MIAELEAEFMPKPIRTKELLKTVRRKLSEKQGRDAEFDLKWHYLSRDQACA